MFSGSGLSWGKAAQTAAALPKDPADTAFRMPETCSSRECHLFHHCISAARALRSGGPYNLRLLRNDTYPSAAHSPRLYPYKLN